MTMLHRESNFRPVSQNKRPNGQPYADPVAEMAACDQLPPNIRYAMNYAPDFMSGPAVLREWRAMKHRGKSETDMIIRLHEACMKYYGRSFIHPV